MGYKDSRFGVPYKRGKRPRRIETAAGKLQTANAGDVRSRDLLCRSREKSTRHLISLFSRRDMLLNMNLTFFRNR